MIPYVTAQIAEAEVEPCLRGDCGAEADGRAKVFFRLYIAGDSRNSYEAQANLQAICSEWLPEQHDIEVVDVFREPLRALDEGVLMTPMLVRLGMPPLRIVGTLNQPSSVIQALGLGGFAA